MEEDELAAKMHGVTIYSDSDSDNSEYGKSDFDEEYEALKPPPISLRDRQQDIVKIAAFKVVCYKNHNFKNLYSKVDGNNKISSHQCAGKSQKGVKINLPIGKTVQYSKKKHAKCIKSVDANCKINEQQCSSLVSNLPPSTKGKSSRSNMKPIYKQKTIYTDSVKSNIHITSMTLKNCDTNSEPTLNLAEVKNCIRKKFSRKRNKTKRTTKKVLEPNSSVVSTLKFSNKSQEENVKVFNISTKVNSQNKIKLKTDQVEVNKNPLMLNKSASNKTSSLSNNIDNMKSDAAIKHLNDCIKLSRSRLCLSFDTDRSLKPKICNVSTHSAPLESCNKFQNMNEQLILHNENSQPLNGTTICNKMHIAQSGVHCKSNTKIELLSLNTSKWKNVGNYAFS